MAIRCINYGFIKPFGKSVVFSDAPDSTPEVKSSPFTDQEKLDVFNAQVEKNLESKNQEVIKHLMEALTKDGGTIDAEEYKNLRDWMYKLDGLEKQLSDGVIDKKAYEESVTALRSVAWGDNLEIPADTIKELELLHKQAEERLQLREAYTKSVVKLEFLVGGNGRLTQADIGSEFANDSSYKIDFGNLTENDALSAQKKYGLKDMLPANVKSVMITAPSKDARLATKGTDGKFYYKDNGKYASVFQNYEIKISGSEVSAEEKAKIDADAQAVLDEAGDPEVLQRIEDKDKIAEYETTLVAETKEEDFSEYWKIKDDFSENAKIQIPEAIQKMDPAQFAADLPYMAHGREVGEALTQLDPSRQIQDVYSDIRNRKLAPNHISLDEISLSIKGKHNWEISNQIPNEDSFKEILILDEIESNEKYTSKRAEIVKLVRNATGFDNSQIEAVLDNRATVVEKKKSFEEVKSFIAASAKLMREVPKLEPKEKADTYDEKFIIKDLGQVEKVAKFIFPNYASEGPVAFRTFLQKILGKGKGTLNMENLHSRTGIVGSDLEKTASGESAYVQLVASAIGFGPEGEPVVNKEVFVAKLNELRKLGLDNVASSSNKDLIARSEDPANKEYLDKPITNDYIFGETAEGVTELERDLMQLGFSRNTEIQRVTDIYEYSEAQKKYPEIFAGLDPVRTPILSAIIKNNPQISEADLKKTSEIVKENMLIMAGVSYHQKIVDDQRNVTNHPGKTVTDIVHGAIAKTFDTPAGTLILAVDSTGNISVAIQNEQKLDKKGRVRLEETAGVSAGLDGTRVGGSIMLKISPDKYLEHNLVLGAAAGAALDRNPGFGLALVLGYELNLEGTQARLEAKYSEDPELNAKLDAEYKAFEAELIAKNVPPELRKALLANTTKFVEDNRSGQAVNDMPKVVLKQASVAITEHGFGVAITVGFKGKDEIFYSIPEQPDQNESARAKIYEQLTSKMGADMQSATQVYVAGEMMMTADGYKTISKSEVEKDKLESINAQLAVQGLQLIPVETENGENRLRLRVTKVHGNVDIFTDNTSGIETYPSSKGDVFINIDEADKISIQRIDSYSQLRKGGGVLNTEIFISNDIRKPTELIKRNSSGMIHTESNIASGQTLDAIFIPNSENAAGSFDSEADAKAAGIEINDLYADMQDVKAAGAEMDKALRSGEYESSLSEDKRKELTKYAKEIVGDDEKLYRRLSVDMKAEEITALILKNPNCQNLSPKEMTYMHQALMVASLAAPKKDAEFVRHIQEWNRTALESQLKDKGMKGVDAKNISTKIMKSYGESLTKWFAEGHAEENFGKFSIPSGAIVQIQVGTQKIEGYRQAFYQPEGSPAILGGVNLTDDVYLTGTMKLTPEEAKLFQDAMTARLSPMETTEQVLKSQLGLSVLSASEIIFGADKCRELTAIVNNKDPQLRLGGSTLDEFLKLVHELREKGRVTRPDGMILNVNLTKEMGFYEACRNFTMVMDEKLSITVPRMAGRVELTSYITGKKQAHYNSIAVATFISTDEKVKPPHERPEAEEEDNVGEKTPPIALEPDQVIPDVIRANADGSNSSGVPTE